ncbi:hypothetical protein DID77_02125 [Candidatus Marinamargulisbacteria bacterium SCGC AG-439-L15]|nr:hypothetical protein DID77_02125 [Candidatus Marinamargulisbacteria bacterium SCGC AG-439-L15]
MRIELTYQKGFKWVSQDGVSVKGYLFDQKNKFYKDKDLISYFSDVRSEEDFRERLEFSNGFFSVLIKKDEVVYAAVDCIRSQPLFYSKNESWIGDNPDVFAKKNGFQQDDSAFKEFRCTGYVAGQETLYSEIVQLQSGEYLVWKKGEVPQTMSYYQYLHKDFMHYTDEQSFPSLEKCINNAVNRLITYANGRQLVVPLSGGYDSRLIVLKLKALGYDNVLCFSYGRPNNKESQVSKFVADYLGYKWIFIDYELIVNDLYFSETLKNYDMYAHRSVSLPHNQDFFAVSYMKAHNMIQTEAVFVPGHSADFLAGSHLTSLELKNEAVSDDQIFYNILKKHYTLFKLNSSDKDRFCKKLENLSPSQPNNGDSSSLLDHWNWRERQSKFIVNSCRVYEFFEYDWVCPLWDKEVVEFFRTLPMSYRREKWFYNQYVNDLDDNLFHLLDQQFGDVSRKSILKSALKTMLQKPCFFFVEELVRVFHLYFFAFPKYFLCIEKNLSFYRCLKIVFLGYRQFNGIETYFFLKRQVVDYR